MIFSKEAISEIRLLLMNSIVSGKGRYVRTPSLACVLMCTRMRPLTRLSYDKSSLARTIVMFDMHVYYYIHGKSCAYYNDIR